jgi:ferritin
MLGKKMQDGFNSQINAELYSAYLYLSMAASFEAKNFSGFAQWLKVQSKEELAHAMRFYGHIVERGGAVRLSAVEGPKTEWKTPLEAFEDAYAHERKVTGMIDALVESSYSEKDNASRSFLKWFVDEQVEEEAQAADIVAKLRMIKETPGALLMMDHRLGKRGKEKE